jgi:aspartate ammonia-lyase
MKKNIRIESDSLGKLAVPQDAYYGIQTLRASQNFPISGLKLQSTMIDAVIMIKKAAAQANMELGRLDREQSQAIEKACDEILEGNFRDQFIVDVFQMGAGTSFHMNCNEVIANRAEEILGGEKGEYHRVHPNDQVNMGQSTNDVFPSAMRLSVLFLLRDHLYGSLSAVIETLEEKAIELDSVLKSGRTHLQDAVPIRMGQEFKAYASVVSKGKTFLEKAAHSLFELGIGGSAVGTGLNTLQKYAEMVRKNLSEMTGFQFIQASDLREAMQSMRPMTEVSGALRNLAIEMGRISNDLRLLASGPNTGLAEINIPPVAPGSSIMPGKVNPSMLEMMNMVCYQVIGSDQVICGAAQAGQLELNVMMPVIAFNLNFMIEIFSNALIQLKTQCLNGISANVQRCRNYAESSIGIATALSPYIGYIKASQLAKEAQEKEKTVVEIVQEKGLLTEEQIKEILDPSKMTEPGIPGKKKK